MPTAYPGAQIEAKAVPLWALFAIEKEARTEIDRRAWEYLRQMGYQWYRELTMKCTIIERNKVQIVQISAAFEQHHQEFAVDHDVPMKQFEFLVPHRPESVP